MISRHPWRSQLQAFVILVASIWSLTTASAQTDERWALVLGNSEYTNANVQSLENTVNDARTMAASLTNMGFTVYLLENATKDSLNTAIEVIHGAHQDSELGLFFFAGHGLQQNGVNYALPSDIDPQASDFLETQGISINAVISQLSNTGVEKLVVVLDSCRNSPFGEEQAFGVGLALVDAPDNTIIAYSTAPGAVALDGSGVNSPFTAALASTLEGPRQDIRDVLKLVRARVRQATGGAQTPWFIDNSNSEIIIQPREEIKLTSRLASSLSDKISLVSTTWATISNSSDSNDFDLFLQLYPDHELSQVAREQISALRGSGQPSLPLMEFGVPDPNPAVPGGLGVIITACDLLATGVNAVLGLADPVPHDLVNTRAALRACIEAVANEPENPRLLGYLARVLKLERRYDESLHFYQLAADHGSSSAYGGIAFAHRFGLGVEENAEKAAEFALKGALLGNVPLRMRMGENYRNGWGVKQSFSEALRWLNIAARSGNSSALTALGDMHLRGEGMPKDPDIALNYYRRAADAGKTDAMNSIGMAYMRGRGVETDLNLGIYWLSRASEEGNPYSAYHLGRAFRKGWGVEQNPKQAIAFFRLSAQRNFLGAYIDIGDMLQGNDGLPGDFPRAYANYIIAIEAAKLRDTISAKKNLAKAEEQLAGLRSRMSPDQVTDGERIATEWIEQYGLLDFARVNQ